MDPLTHKLKGIINLDEDETLLTFDEDGSASFETPDSHCLYARVLSRKPVYLSTFQKQMKPHWDGRFEAKISEIEPAMFIIFFGCEGDKERVLA